MNLRNHSSVKDRRQAVEKETGVMLPHTGTFTLDEGVAGSRNCENMIGATQIPLGIAGPLVIAGVETAHAGQYYVPLTTTEGALVASVNRGCKAIAASGGATVDSVRSGASRGPVFRTGSLSENRKLQEFIETHERELKAVAEQTSHHLQLTEISSQAVGVYRYIRFVYDTQDAMGLNMVTIATDAVARYIEKQTGAACVALSGNFCVDKKPSWQNAIRTRGTAVWAEATIPQRVLADVLKTDAAHIHETWVAKCMLGSAVSGSMGFNAQYANVVAAIFLSTGQDPAHVVEGSLGVTTAEIRDGKDIYMSVYMPDLMIGTVGGGTALATQQEALSLLGVSGGSAEDAPGSNARKLAEIIAGSTLAGELSLLSSLEQGTLAQAHQTLARGRKS